MMPVLSRDAEVMTVIRKNTRSVTASVVARLLNRPVAASECDWCPIDGLMPPPNQCRSVPESSRKACDRILRRLWRCGQLVKVRVGRKPEYVLPEVAAEFHESVIVKP